MRVGEEAGGACPELGRLDETLLAKTAEPGATTAALAVSMNLRRETRLVIFLRDAARTADANYQMNFSANCSWRLASALLPTVLPMVLKVP